MTVTLQTVRGRPGCTAARPVRETALSGHGPSRPPPARSCTLPAMFAHSTRSWWWTAHPAAH
ncbi:trp operon leader peptide [Streptomyces sp. SHP 1-2]|nr:trp operon leader peptide [Streptomyces sp. SHP 1-2]MYU21522.1 trp operon leader peptide [Streptomyces sp. SID8352]